MATLRQKQLARALVKNLASKESQSMGKILESIGYAKSTSEAIPGQIVNSKGVKDELQILGISLDEADKYVGNVLRTGRPMEILKAADIIYKRLGGYTQEKKEFIEISRRGLFEPTPEEKERIDKAISVYLIQEDLTQKNKE